MCVDPIGRASTTGFFVFFFLFFFVLFCFFHGLIVSWLSSYYGDCEVVKEADNQVALWDMQKKVCWFVYIGTLHSGFVNPKYIKS